MRSCRDNNQSKHYVPPRTASNGGRGVGGRGLQSRTNNQGQHYRSP